MDTQKKNIKKTVLIIVVLMSSILLLFLNKITTARYLSNIELKINGLVLLDKAEMLDIKNESAQWLLVANTEKQKELLDEFKPSLRKKAKNATQIVLAPIQLQSQLNKFIPNYSSNISIINPDHQLIGYLKPPFDEHKMLLTYSSVFTHR